jgi:hypothetical protein
MKKVLFAFFFLTTPVWGDICRDTLRVNANGGFNNWDDCNTAGCAATASNYLRVNTDATTDTIATDVDVSCSFGNLLTSHHVADFNEVHISIDTVRIRVKLWGTAATDSARIGMKIGTDTIWSSRFLLSGSPIFKEFTSHTDPHGNGWEKASFDSLEICVSPKVVTLGRIFDTEEVAIVVSQTPNPWNCTGGCSIPEGKNNGIFAARKPDE